MPEQGDNRRHTRRRFLTAAGASVTAFVAGCVGGDDDGGGDNNTGNGGDNGGSEDPAQIDFVLNPAVESVDIEAQYQPLFNAIEDEFNVVMNGIKTSSYSGTASELEAAGEGDRVYADTSPNAVPQLGDAIDVVGLRVAFGAEKYFSLMVTQQDNGINSLRDLEGETVATQGVASLSGGVAPFWMLQDAGLDIGNAPDGGNANDFDWVQATAHDTTVNQVVGGEVAAGGAGAFVTVEHVTADQITSAENGDTLAEISPDFADAGTADTQLQLLRISPPLPRAPILANAGWDDDLRDQIDQFMLDAEPSQFVHDAFNLAEELGLDLPDQLLEDYNNDEVADDVVAAYDLSDAQAEDWTEFEDNELWFSGITDGTVEDYDPIGQFADDIGLDFGS
ncbi:MAG: ABC-type phosphate/phosphonate transport system, periplasmic component [halophilic archaeon J07HX64]|jgi:ABC-type phosphate/phosphonate transport system, periplasmic component|nr:MAG: ABC-type phosphate/phosphonate transport system, periplasmic component [halophilic archaeon J07HX64]